MSKANFKETLQYQSKLVPILLGLVSLATAIRGVDFLSASEPQLGNAILSFTVAAASVALIWWLRKLKLKVAITAKNIKFKLSPLHEKKQSIPWKEIDECEIVRTTEAAQWSGGNITFNHEKRYSLTGRNGLAIKTKKGECFFIGCRDILGLQHALDKMKLK